MVEVVSEQDTIAAIIARAYGGSLYPELGVPGDYPVADVDRLAADAVLATLRAGGAREAELVEALRPFAEPGSSDQYIASDAPDEGWCAARSFRAGDYRRARAALASAAGGEGL